MYGQRINDPSAASSPPSPLHRFADVLNPKNNMPVEPNQLPCPGQRKPLPTERVQSNIPKGGTDGTWLYPSPQMVFNGGWPAACMLAALGSRVGGCSIKAGLLAAASPASHTYLQPKCHAPHVIGKHPGACGSLFVALQRPRQTAA